MLSYQAPSKAFELQLRVSARKSSPRAAGHHHELREAK